MIGRIENNYTRASNVHVLTWAGNRLEFESLKDQAAQPRWYGDRIVHLNAADESMKPLAK